MASDDSRFGDPAAVMASSLNGDRQSRLAPDTVRHRNSADAGQLSSIVFEFDSPALQEGSEPWQPGATASR
jgi:hypothetical protein